MKPRVSLRFNGAILDDPLGVQILVYLAGRYVPVTSDWVDFSDIAEALRLPADEVQSHCERLKRETLIETAPADAEHDSPAAVITVKGLLAVGRVP